MKISSVLSLVLVVALVATCGCTGTPAATPSGTGTSAGTQAQQTGSSLVPGPTDKMPDYNAVTVDVGEKDYLGLIPVIFQGGKGLAATKKIDVKLTLVDGSTKTATVGTNKGDEVELQGTRGEGSNRGQADRVEVWVTMNNGQTYKIVDTLREYRTR
jgi:hypothetical protein